jgi:predicted RecB family endonuclease
VTTVIDGARQQFADSTIRDFVPLLVERRAEEELARQLADDSAT